MKNLKNICKNTYTQLQSSVEAQWTIELINIGRIQLLGLAVFSPAVWQCRDKIRNDERLGRCIVRDWKNKQQKEIDNDGDDGNNNDDDEQEEQEQEEETEMIVHLIQRRYGRK